jgi:hypothetical protein
MSQTPIASGLTFEGFSQQWLTEITEGNPSTVELGHRFARKLIVQWLDLDESTVEPIYCDGSGDGGIDAAYLDGGQEETTEEGTQGDTWFLIQSKYGKAFQGTATLLQEGQKVIDTLDGKHGRLSSLAEGLLEQLTNFRGQSSERDKIVLVFATIDTLNEEQARVLSDLRAMGRNRLGTGFDCESISLAALFQRTIDEPLKYGEQVRVVVKGNLTQSGQGLLVGSISLLDLYAFLKTYRQKTQDLDQLYEKNVRRFLGGRGKVNKGIQDTLYAHPENFGLYNNGITIVVEEYHQLEDSQFELLDPFVVNGCQTTRTIWDVFYRKLDSGGTGKSTTLEDWKEHAAQGVVVTKIAQVGSEGEDLLEKITRYTNSQNAVKEKDFLALTSDFRTWARQMEEEYNIFLEIQRAAWDSRLALQKQRPDIKQFKVMCNAFDLIKVYGSGWLAEAGTALNKNAPFQPNGTIFKKIVNQDELNIDDRFDIRDLYASYLLKTAADQFNFGRKAIASRASRRQTRFLFYFVFVELLKDILVRMGEGTGNKAVTRAIIKLSDADQAWNDLLAAAIDVIDSYLTSGTDNCVFDEPIFKNTYNSDLGNFLRWDQLTKAKTPMLSQLLEVTKMSLRRARPNEQSTRELVQKALQASA